MNSLKAALGKQDNKGDKVTSNMSVSRKKFSNSKSESMWALEMQQKDIEMSLSSDQKLQLLNGLLKTAFEKDHKLSANIFDRIVQDFQEQLGTSQNKSQISYYLVLEDKITDLIDLYSTEKGQKSELILFLQEFHENVQDRIAMLRSKDKKSHLQNFDKIADRNFKKKAEFLDIGGIRVDIAVKSRQKSSGAHHSKEKKLNRLLSKEKTNLRQKQKQTSKHQDHDDYMLSESMTQNNQSVSYSAIMSNSVAVKQRRPRKKSSKCEQYFMSKTQLKEKKSVQNEQDNDKTDKAFIFFRPKKTAKH